MDLNFNQIYNYSMQASIHNFLAVIVRLKRYGSHFNQNLLICTRVWKGGNYHSRFFFQGEASYMAKCALLVNNRTTYADAKAFCSAQSFTTFFGKRMNAQMMDISGNNYVLMEREWKSSLI